MARMRFFLAPSLISVLIAASSAVAAADLAQAPPARPAAKVVTAKAVEGVLAPSQDFTGTVFFKEVSEVATEVSGKVIAVEFEEGQRVKKGEPLVRLDGELIHEERQAMTATRARYQSELEDAQARMERARVLIQDEVTTPQQFDELRFEVQSKTHQVASMDAELRRMQTLIEKNSIAAPFDGIVLDRQTELGEWKSNGATLAVLALENVYDVMVNLPEEYLAWTKPGDRVALHAAGQIIDGVVAAVVPKGDVASRTFPVKVRVEGDYPLSEGMSAVARLPIGPKTECILIPRDAILNDAGKTFVFAVDEKMTAVKYPVDIIGYDGMNAGIRAENLRIADPLIVKGQERLRGGETVELVPDDAFGPRPSATG